MTTREQDEYTELRATIRQRGTARVWIFVGGIAAGSRASRSIARFAASLSSRGVAKSGKPCARLTPPCRLQSCVMPRMTDSVKLAAFAEVPSALSSADERALSPDRTS